MPYTPPSPSPSATNSNSRTSSRSSSFSTPTTSTIAEHSAASATPSRASTYLQKHRRSQGYNRNAEANVHGKSVQPSTATVSVTSPTSERVSIHLLNPPRSISSLRQSPAPINKGAMIPTGAVISPPDSSQNSSDDEASDDSQTRGRQLVNMAELEEALSSLPQHRVPSPDQSPVAMTEQNMLSSPLEMSSPEMLSARIHNKIAHSRSSSDSTALRNAGRKVVTTTKVSDNDSDEEELTIKVAPPMVRKKSGELVKSSLKSPGGRRRPSSMPSTPTYPKAVHFDAHLEHVRHFLQAERPTAVSAGSSPVETAVENEGEFPFPHDDEDYEPPFEWELNLPNFPDKIDRSGWIVRVERVYLSHDNKNLLGTVAVANISFHKFVVARFTFDYWQTTSETVAEYNDDVRRKLKEDGYDRFSFKIRLDEISNLENKTLFFCVRYKVNGQEHWDNNSSINYQVDFKKKYIRQNGKHGNPRAVTLPRSRPTPNRNPRPRSMPLFDDSFDAFDGGRQGSSKYMFPPTISISGEPRQKKSAKVSLVDDGHENPARRTTPSGNAFGNRYDFETSLANAITTAAKVLGPERSGLTFKANNALAANPSPYFKNSASLGSELTKSSLPRSHSSPALAATPGQLPTLVSKSGKPLNAPLKPLFKHLDSEEKPSIESPSYRELLDNYCFFGSANASPSLATGGNMPDKPSTKHIDEVNTNGLVLPVYNFGVPTSRSPSPRIQITGGSPRFSPTGNLSMSPSQRSSESSSPISIAFGFPNRGLAMDSTHTPTAVQT